MYDEREMAKGFKLLTEKICDFLIDQVMPLKMIVKVLRRKIYLWLNLEEQVEYFVGVWKLYITLVNIGLPVLAWFLESRQIKISQYLWGTMNIGIIVGFWLYKLFWFLTKNIRKTMKSGILKWLLTGEPGEVKSMRPSALWRQIKRMAWDWMQDGERNREERFHNIYEQEEVTKQWYLRETHVKWRVFWFCCMTFWLVMLGLAWVFFEQHKEMIQYFYPAAIAIFFYERWLQHEWMTREECYRIEFNMEEPGDEMTTDAMEADLRDIPQCSVLDFDSSRQREQGMTEDELHSILMGDSHEKALLREFCARWPDVMDKGRELLESALELIGGDSVFFRTFFYKDIDYAFLLSAYMTLVRGQNVLLVCSEKAEAKEMLRWMRDGIRDMNGLDWWRFEAYQPFCSPGNVEVVYGSEFHAFYTDDRHISFRKKLGMMLLQEPSEYTESCLEEIKQLCKRKGEKICLAVCSGTLDMMDRLSWCFAKDIVCKGQLWKPGKRVLSMYWKEENPGQKAEDSCGVEITLLKYLLEKAGAGKILWMSGGLLPVWNILWAYRRYSDMEIDDRVLPTDYGCELQLKERTFIIAEDYVGNYKRMFEMLISRGVNQVVIHVVVPAYLLRSYIRDGGEDPLLKEGLSHRAADLQRSIVRSVFLKLTEGWVSAEWLKEKIEFPDCSGEEMLGNLGKLIRKYLLGGECAVVLERRFGEEECCRVRQDEAVRRFLRENAKVRFVSDFEEDEEIKTDLTYNTIFQKYIPGQYLALKNRSYWFVGVIQSGRQYLAKIQKNIQMVNGKTYYRQMREVVLENRRMLAQEMDINSNVGGIKWRYEEADILVKTRAYLSMPSFMDIEHAVKILCKNVPDRKYYGKRYIKIELEENERGAARMIATWLKEAFYTLCRDDVDYMDVCVEGCRDSASVYDIKLCNTLSKDRNSIYIIEDREEDSGILQDIYYKQDKIMDMMRRWFNIYQIRDLQTFLQVVDWRGFLDGRMGV